MARRLNRPNKTISQDLKRCNSSNHYSAETAQQEAITKRYRADKFTKFSDAHKRIVDYFLSLHWTPEQIAGRMQAESVTHAVSWQPLYRWIEKLQRRSRLPRKGKAYRKRAGKEAGARLIPNRIDIDERSGIVDENIEIGHWEG